MLKKVWMDTRSTLTWKPKVEEHEYEDGTLHYIFLDRVGRTHTVSEPEAKKIIGSWGMEDITEKMRNNGWIE